MLSVEWRSQWESPGSSLIDPLGEPLHDAGTEEAAPDVLRLEDFRPQTVVCADEGVTFGRRDVRSAMKAASMEIGLPPHLAGRVSSHELRRHFATRAIERGAPLDASRHLLTRKHLVTAAKSPRRPSRRHDGHGPHRLGPVRVTKWVAARSEGR